MSVCGAYMTSITCNSSKNARISLEDTWSVCVCVYAVQVLTSDGSKQAWVWGLDLLESLIREGIVNGIESCRNMWIFVIIRSFLCFFYDRCAIFAIIISFIHTHVQTCSQDGILFVGTGTCKDECNLHGWWAYAHRAIEAGSKRGANGCYTYSSCDRRPEQQVVCASDCFFLHINSSAMVCKTMDATLSVGKFLGIDLRCV